MISQPPLLWLLDTALSVYIFVLFADAILSWLLVFRVVNPFNPLVARLQGVLRRLTEPVLRPIRKVVPTMAGMDFAPMILIFALFFVQYTLNYYWPR